jgi:hypothetical protein
MREGERERERESKYAQSISAHIFILPQYPTMDTINTRKYARTYLHIQTFSAPRINQDKLAPLTKPPRNS